MKWSTESHFAGREMLALLGARVVAAVALSLALFVLSGAAAQKKPAAKPKSKHANVASELTKLQDEYIRLTKEVKANLAKLRVTYEKDVVKAEARLAQSKELFDEGLLSRSKLEESEQALAAAKDNVAKVDQQNATADSQIADTLLEADAEAKAAKSKPIPKGGFVSTTAMIRYNGAAVWTLSDAWRVQQFFLGAFKKPLPVAVFGQGAIHDRWRLDHHNSMDISLHPDGPEGQALLGYLRANGIPFLAFRAAIPGTATGPHIHVGRPSHRY